MYVIHYASFTSYVIRCSLYVIRYTIYVIRLTLLFNILCIAIQYTIYFMRYIL